MDANDMLALVRAPTARRPLLGQTVLVVEDSRYASETVRLMCLRSGARIRRADSLDAAHRHLAVYLPSVLLVDVGLPDGSGIDLISAVSDVAPRIDVIVGTSGDSVHRNAVMAAGADDFIEKPVGSLNAFQAKLLLHVPTDRQPPARHDPKDDVIAPDLVAYHDDLSHVAQVLRGDAGDLTIDYVTQFLGGVARSVHDHDLTDAVAALARARSAGHYPTQGVATLSQMVQSRIAAAGPI